MTRGKFLAFLIPLVSFGYGAVLVVSLSPALETFPISQYVVYGVLGVIFAIQFVVNYTKRSIVSALLFPVVMFLVAILVRPDVKFMSVFYFRQMWVAIWISAVTMLVMGIAIKRFFDNKWGGLVASGAIFVASGLVAQRLSVVIGIDYGDFNVFELVFGASAAYAVWLVFSTALTRSFNADDLLDTAVFAVGNVAILGFKGLRVALAFTKIQEEDESFELLEVNNVANSEQPSYCVSVRKSGQVTIVDLFVDNDDRWHISGEALPLLNVLGTAALVAAIEMAQSCHQLITGKTFTIKEVTKK